jgi:hypothetical protein
VAEKYKMFLPFLPSSGRAKLLFSVLTSVAVAVFLIVIWVAMPKRVFPESILTRWGYKTTEITKNYHSIRSFNNYGDTNEAFYARFGLSVLSFHSEASATKAKTNFDTERESTILGRDKDYIRYIQKGCVLYVVTAMCNYTRLEHQPALVKNIEAHL